MSKLLLEPIHKFSNRKIWILNSNEEEDSVNKEKNLFSSKKSPAMRAITWKKILHNANSFENVLSIFGEKLKNIKNSNDKNKLSYPAVPYDKLILTRAILDSKLCNLTSSPPPWTTTQINSDPTSNIKENPANVNTCYFHSNLNECSKKTFKNNDINCFYWHFTPEDTKQDILNVYLSIGKWLEKDQ